MSHSPERHKLLKEINNFEFKNKNKVRHTLECKQKDNNESKRDTKKVKKKNHQRLNNNFTTYHDGNYDPYDDDYGVFYPDYDGNCDDGFRDCSGKYFEDANDAFAYGDIDWGSN